MEYSAGAQLSNPTGQLTGRSKHVVAVVCCYRTEITVSSEKEVFLQVILVIVVIFRNPITTVKGYM